MQPIDTVAGPQAQPSGTRILPELEMGPDDERSMPPALLQYWHAAVRWRWLVGTIIAACLAAGVVLTMLTAPLFAASSRIEISREQKNITNVQGVDEAANPYDMEFYDTQYALLRAGSLAERVARNLKLGNEPSFFAAHGVKVPATEPGGGSPAQQSKARENLAAGLLLGGIKVVPVQSSRLADIVYTSRSPSWSARIANAWPQAFIAASMDRQFATTADARRFLESRLENLRQKLEQSERNLINFGNASNIVTLSVSRDANGKTEEPRTLVASNLDALNTALMAARTDRIAAESRARAGVGASSPELLENATISGLRGKRAELASEYARLLAQYDPRFPKARVVKQQIDALDSAIGRETVRVGGSRQVNYREAVMRENELAAQVQSLKAQFGDQQRATIQYNIYQREVDTNRQLYNALLQRYKEIGLAGSVGTTNVVIVDQAKVPGGPSSPNLQRNLMLALFLGIALAAATVFALEQFDEGLRDPSEIEQRLRLPLLGTAPLTDYPEAQFTDPKSGIAEAYFSIRTTLGLATSNGFPKSLAVTSAQPGEGKSVTALGLAVAIGRTGKTVLLIDADMRSPSVHGFVNRENSGGLSNILAGEGDATSLISASEFKGVSTLLAGPSPPSAAELLSTDRLRHLIEIGRASCRERVCLSV